MIKLIFKITAFFCFFNPLNSQNFLEIQKIVSQERMIGGEFGSTIQFYGEYAIFGSESYNKIISPNDTIFDAGAIFIYKKDNLNFWHFYQKIENPRNRLNDKFAYDFSISDNYTLAIITAGSGWITYPNSEPSKIYIYKLNEFFFWELEQEITPPREEYINAPVNNIRISDDFLVAATHQNNTDESNLNSIENAGAVFIYKKNSSGIWVVHQKLVASDRKPGNSFGSSISLNKTFLMIGMPYENSRISNIQNMGTVFSFVLDGNGNWIEHQKLISNYREVNALFGHKIDMVDSVLVISGFQGNLDENGEDFIEKSGALHIFELQSDGLWLETKKLLPEPRVAFLNYGRRFSIHKDLIVVGNPREDLIGETGQLTSKTGSIFIYKKNEIAGWELIQKIFPDSIVPFKYFGRNVKVFDNQILIGANGEKFDEKNEDPLLFAGAAYYYKACTPTQFTDTLTSCDQLTWLDGITYTSNNNTAQYKITNTLGCDSIITLNLTIFPSQNITETQTACNSYTWNNQTYTQSGSYTYQTINANGCDSIAILDLTIFPSSDENISHTACDAYIWNNQTYTQSGLYTFQTTNQYGCDSIISLDLTVNPAYQETITHTTCDDYTWNGQTYNQSGVYTYATTNQFGCDSILTLDLKINNTILTNEAQTACDVYFWNNQTYTQSGLYTYQTINGDGCDSIATLDLTIFQSNEENISHTACDSYFWNNQTYTQSGLYTFQTTNQYGCDSIISLDLTVNPSYQETITYTTCDDYTWNGQTYNQSGVYTYATTNQFGCDSILTLDLTIINTIYFSETQTACDVYFWNNQTYTQSGSYTYQTINGDGCDSIANLELIIFESNNNNIFQSACQSFEYENQILTESGIYTFNLQNSFGCDSIVTLELEILDQFTSQSVSSCDQYIWPANGQTYLQSGIYTDTLQNVFGCDSVLQLDLNISPSFNIPDQKEVCDQYLWTPNNTTYTQSGFYQLDLKTAQGCDSILTLDLTIHPAFMQIDTVISSTEYTWQINNTTYATSGIYTEKWLTPSECDSIHQLLLTIKTDSDIYFPNIILPNSQNSNFTIFGSNSIELIQSLSIYDRWSNLVFHQENFPPNQSSLGWNGKFRGQLVIPGVYVWTAQIRLSDGTTLMKTGDVTVVE